MDYTIELRAKIYAVSMNYISQMFDFDWAKIDHTHVSYQKGVWSGTTQSDVAEPFSGCRSWF